MDAYHEAGNYHHMNMNDDTPVHMIPGNCATVTTNNGNIISSSYKHVIHTAPTTPALLAKIQEQNRWTPNEDMNLIHWMALGRATRRMPSRTTHIVKLLHHDLLLMAVMVHRCDP
jgi:hypothetical protein